MGSSLYLQDFSPVPEEEIPFCKRVQEAIDQGEIFVTDLTTLGKDQEHQAQPKIFGDFLGKYRVKKYVGVIGYQNRQIIIQSRFDRQEGRGEQQGNNQNFLQYMLAQGVVNHIKIFQDSQITTQEGGMYLLLVPFFLEEVRKATGQGQYRQYRTDQHNDSRFRGTIHISRHIQENMMANHGKIAYNTRERTLDNPLNRLILMTASYLASHPATRDYYARLSRHHQALLRPIQALRNHLPWPEVSVKGIQKAVSSSQSPITHPFYYGFEKVRQICHMILNGKGTTLALSDMTMDAGIVFDMSRGFEMLLERKVFVGEAFQGRIQSQNNINLFYNEKTSRKLRPDFIYDGQPDLPFARAVFDAKNKLSWASVHQIESQSGGKTAKARAWSGVSVDDVRQMLSYLVVTRAEVCGILCPSHHGVPTQAVGVDLVEGVGGLPKFHVIPLVIPEAESYPAFFQQMEENCGRCRRELEKILPGHEETTSPEQTNPTE